MNRVAETGQFRDKVSELIEQFGSPIHEQTFSGADAGPPLEHVTRKHFVDPFLKALGWDLSKLNEQIVEEARTRGETTLRLDYLGVNPETRAPLLIVEAKPWTAPFVTASSSENSAGSADSLICAAIEHCKAEGVPKDSPVTFEWAKYLAKLRQYVATVKAESDHAVKRVATLSGQWLVVFDDPDAVFLATGTVNPLLIHIYRGSDFVTKAEEIFNLLAQSSLGPAVPPMLRPSLVTAYARASDIRRAYRALWITYRATGASFRARPTLELDAAVVLERGDNALLVVVDKSLQWQEIPHDPAELDAHIDAVAAQADLLLVRIDAELSTNLQPSGVEIFPGFPRGRIAGNPNGIQSGIQPRIDLIKIATGAGEFLLVTGIEQAFPSKSTDHSFLRLARLGQL